MPDNLACNFCHLWWPNNKDYWTDDPDEGYGKSGNLINIYRLIWPQATKIDAGSSVVVSHLVSENVVTPILDYAACFDCHGKTFATKGGHKVYPFHGLGAAVTGFESMSGDSGHENVLINWYAGPTGSGQNQAKRNQPHHPGFGGLGQIGELADGTNLVRAPTDGGHQYSTDTRKAHDLDESQWRVDTSNAPAKSGTFNIPWDDYDAGKLGGTGISPTINAGGQSGGFATSTIVPLVPLSLPQSLTP
jgi:hypothetical protein